MAICGLPSNVSMSAAAAGPVVEVVAGRVVAAAWVAGGEGKAKDQG
jgi:hypothetical protein